VPNEVDLRHEEHGTPSTAVRRVYHLHRLSSQQQQEQRLSKQRGGESGESGERAGTRQETATGMRGGPREDCTREKLSTFYLFLFVLFYLFFFSFTFSFPFSLPFCVRETKREYQCVTTERERTGDRRDKNVGCAGTCRSRGMQLFYHSLLLNPLPIPLLTLLIPLLKLFFWKKRVKRV
jgi:hypothetical protein